MDWMACQQELQAEIDDVRAAMEVSLQEAEQQRAESEQQQVRARRRRRSAPGRLRVSGRRAPGCAALAGGRSQPAAPGPQPW
jgi:hypothetical protein